MRIGVFSDDLGGPLAAIMLARGLAELGDPVLVASPASSGLWDRRDEAADASHVRAIDLAEGHEGEHIAEAARHGQDVVASLPLASLRDASVTPPMDLRIVVGKDHAAAARALRAARCEPSRAVATPWFLAFTNQAVLRSEAGLLPTAGIPLPYCTRALPTALPRFGRHLEDCLLRGEFPQECRRTGILLAALATAAVALPGAIRIEARDLAALMEADSTPSESRVSKRLLGLASAFEGVVPSEGVQPAPVPRSGTARRHDPRRGHPAQPAASSQHWRSPAASARRPL